MIINLKMRILQMIYYQYRVIIYPEEQQAETRLTND
jgi:hypothetical protein